MHQQLLDIIYTNTHRHVEDTALLDFQTANDCTIGPTFFYNSMN